MGHSWNPVKHQESMFVSCRFPGCFNISKHRQSEPYDFFHHCHCHYHLLVKWGQQSIAHGGWLTLSLASIFSTVGKSTRIHPQPPFLRWMCGTNHHLFRVVTRIALVTLCFMDATNVQKLSSSRVRVIGLDFRTRWRTLESCGDLTKNRGGHKGKCEGNDSDDHRS